MAQANRLKIGLLKTVETVKNKKVLHSNPRLKSWDNEKKLSVITVLTVFNCNRST